MDVSHNADPVLLQTHDQGFYRANCDFSRKLNKNQLNYSITEKETLALHLGSGWTVEIFTDNSSFFLFFHLSQKLIRCFLFLQSYCALICYIEWDDNMMSHDPVQKKIKNPVETTVTSPFCPWTLSVTKDSSYDCPRS